MKSYFKKRAIFFLVFILVIFGGFLRFNHLGDYSFYAFDSATSALAVKSILENGYPILPSGNFYSRGLAYHYLTAGVSYLFGLNEFSLRFISAFFGVMTVPLIFLLGRKFFSNSVAILSAFFICFSLWSIEFSRYARFYTQFQFLYLASLYLFYEGFLNERKSFQYWFILFFIFTLLTHLLAVSLLSLFLFLFIVKDKKEINRREIIIFLSLLLISSIWFNLESSWFKKIIASTPVLQKFVLPKFDFLNTLLSTYPHNLFFIVALILCFVLLTRKFLIKEKDKYSWLMNLTILILVATGQIILAVILFALFAYIKRTGLNLRLKNIQFSIVLLIVGTIFWIIWSIFFLRESPISNALRNLFILNFPNTVFIYYLFKGFSYMAIFVFVSLLFIFHKASLREEKKENIFIAWSFFIPLIIMGLFSTHNEPRYNFFLLPLFILLYFYVVFYLTTNYLKPKLLKYLFATTAIIFSLKFAHPVEAVHIAYRKYGEAVNAMFSPSTYITYYPDHKSAAEYVKSRLQNKDLVVAYGSSLNYFYIGKLDYALLSKPDYRGRNKDIPISDPYTGVRIVDSLNKLEYLIAKYDRVWLVTTGIYDGESQKGKIALFLQDMSKSVVYIAKDGRAKVFLFSKT